MNRVHYFTSNRFFCHVLHALLFFFLLHAVILIVYKRCARFTGKRWHTMHQAFCNFIFILSVVTFGSVFSSSLWVYSLESFVWIASEQMNNSKDKKGHMKLTKKEKIIRQKNTRQWKSDAYEKELQRNCSKEHANTQQEDGEKSTKLNK